jgi:microcystin-dependent protein
MAEPFLGQILLVGFNFAPQGWALCNGQLLSITQNTALFSLLGTQYGGDGQTTFALPDLRSRVPIHQGQGNGLSNYAMGEMAGVENVTLLLSQIPSHNHLINATNAAGGVQTPGNNFLAAATAGGRPADIYSAGPSQGTLSPNAVSVAGGGQPHTNIQPVLAMNYIIALQGIFPSRS